MRFFAVILFTVCCYLGLIASPREYYQLDMQHLTQENGMANNTIYSIHQDKNGFLWLGTDVGISRYDGIHFHNYELIDIEPQAIKRICEMEQDQLLWLELGRNHRIACFDKTNGEYIPLECDSGDYLANIYDLCIADSVLYALTPRGIEHIDYRRTGQSIHVTPELTVAYRYSLKRIVSDDRFLYALDQAGNVLIWDIQGKKQQVVRYSRFKTSNPLNDIHIMNGCLWIMSEWNGTYCYDAVRDELRELDLGQVKGESLHIGHVTMKNDSTFFASTPNSILRISFSGTDYIHDSIEVSTISFEHFKYEPFIKNRITDLYMDRNNHVMWIGTFGKGMLKSSLSDDDIDRIYLNDGICNVNGVVEDTHGYIWLTTNHMGVWRSTSNVVSPKMKFERWERSSKDSYYCMFEDESGQLWVGGEEGTVYQINPFTDQVTSYHPTYDGVNSIGSINKIYFCIHNRLWLVSEKGLFIYDYQNDRCLGSMPYNETIYKITALCEDRDGIMWLGTNDGVRTAVLKGKDIHLSNGREQQAGVSKSEVLEIYMNRYNQIYIAYADKVVQIDEHHENFEDIKILQRDITSGHVECIIDDKNGNSWLGNNIGIMTINNKTKASYTYNFPERFYDVCQLSDGRLLWTNSAGLMCFDPRVLKEKSLSGKLYISDIGVNYNIVDIGEEINGQTILKKPAYLTDELVLNHENNSVIFYLTNLKYKQMPNKIEYRLLPLQDEWTTTYRSEINYSNLAPGDYTLEIRPISINEEETDINRLKIHIQKYWAATGWAIGGYILMLGLFIASYYYYIRAKKDKRDFYRKKDELLKNMLAEEIKGRKEENTIYHLCNQARGSLMREMKTPLSLIVSPLKEMVNASSLPTIFQQKAKTAYRNAIGMQNVCDLMQEIYEQEREELTLNVAEYPAMNVIYNAITPSNELLNVAPIKLHYDKSNRVSKEIWIDYRKMKYILQNVLSNAFRHISYSGNVYMDLLFETIEEKEYCVYRIKDDGKEMIKEKATYLLSREEGGKELTRQLHPELGIILMKEHIVAHHGDIRIEQDPETGTCVSIYIPMGKEHFEGDTRVTFVEPETIRQADEKTADAIITLEEKEQQIKEEQERISLLVTPNGGKHKMLIIEDHKDIRLYLKVLFSSEYSIIMAENGEEGVKMARHELPDIILTDIMMPVMDGFEATRILKEDLKTCHIPIIHLTALTGDTNAVKGIEYGADDYILKPFNAEILRSKVKRLIENRQNLKQAYMKLMMTSGAMESDGAQEEGGQKEDPFIKQIFEIVENNLRNPDFNVKRLAEMVNMSQPTLYRRVKMLTNYTIIELIRGVRLKNAADLLRTKKYSIQEVSEMVGYNDAPTFRKHFVDFYGVTPSQFANKEEASEKKMVV